MISTLLVGFGFSATTFHLPFLNYLPQFSIDLVISSKPDAVKAVLPDAEVYSSLEEALKIHDVDLVVITTPNHLHGQQARMALEHSCHVLVEKPFTLNSEEAEALVDLANAQNKQLCVYHNRRFDGDFLTIKKLIDDGVEYHEDLNDDNGTSRVLQGYTATNPNGYGRPESFSHNHGEPCAGIIGASHNNIGVRG